MEPQRSVDPDIGEYIYSRDEGDRPRRTHRERPRRTRSERRHVEVGASIRNGHRLRGHRHDDFGTPTHYGRPPMGCAHCRRDRRHRFPQSATRAVMGKEQRTARRMVVRYRFPGPPRNRIPRDASSTRPAGRLSPARLTRQRMSDNTLDRDDILALFDELSTEADLEGIKIELFLVGGAAMTLA